ncbi:hypothetical protein ES703_53651 [subsurface metagenome]
MNEKEINVKERNKKENQKSFWKNFKENWLWVTIGFYIGITSMGWIEYFRGCFSLIGVVLPTFIAPIFLFGIFYIRKSMHQRVIGRLITVIGGGLALGFPIWIFVNYILLVAPWAPFHEINGILQIIFSILGMLLSYGGAAYIMDKLGKKRDYRPFL